MPKLDMEKAKPSLRLKKHSLNDQAEDLAVDSFEELEEAVKKRKLVGFQTSDLPPILSTECLFTKAIPLGMQNMFFCRSPSNRIGIYNSPASMDLGTLDVSRPKFTPPEIPPLRFELPSHARHKRPWRHPDPRPNELTKPYKVPLLTDEELEFLRESSSEEYIVPEQITKRGEYYVHSNQAFVDCPLDGQHTPGAKTLHSYVKLGKDTDDSITERKDESSRRDLDDKEKYFPHIVQSPRSLHISTCLKHPPLTSNVLEAADRILKYQYYIEAGIDESFIAPIRERWIKNAVHHVGKHAIQGLSQETVSNTLQHVAEEVHHEYILSMRKAIIDYVLQDMVERKRLGLTDMDKILQVITTSYFSRSHTIQVLLPEWRMAVLNAHGKMAGTLYRLHPLSLEIANVWQNSFSNKLMFDVNTGDFRSKMPFDLLAFLSRQNLCALSTKDALENEWFKVAGEILKQAVPIPPHRDLEGFYEAMAVLMTNQIRRLLEDSIINLAKFFSMHCQKDDSLSVSKKHVPTAEKYEKLFEGADFFNQNFSSFSSCTVPPFTVTLKYHNGVYSVEPSFEEIESALLGLVDLCSYDGSEVAFVDAKGEKIPFLTFSNIEADKALVKVSKQFLSEAVCSNAQKPMALGKAYDLLEDLANMDAEAFAREFRAQEKTLVEYESTIEAFNQRAIEAEFASANDVDCGLVRVICAEFKGHLSGKARRVCTLLKDQILVDVIAVGKEVSTRCERIARDITKVSTTSEEAVSLQK